MSEYPTASTCLRGVSEAWRRSPGDEAVGQLLLRLVIEVEALREALSSPQTPESVRQAYREAYARTAVLSHNAAGPSGGVEKILARYFPRGGANEPFGPELQHLERLGVSAEDRQALRDRMEDAEMNT